MAIDVINTNRVCGELAQSLLEDSEGARRANVDPDDEETAPGLSAARGVFFGVVLGAACWLVMIAVGDLVWNALS